MENGYLITGLAGCSRSSRTLSGSASSRNLISVQCAVCMESNSALVFAFEIVVDEILHWTAETADADRVAICRFQLIVHEALNTTLKQPRLLYLDCLNTVKTTNSLSDVNRLVKFSASEDIIHKLIRLNMISYIDGQLLGSVGHSIVILTYIPAHTVSNLHLI
jgi:hypothetical protein